MRRNEDHCHLVLYTSGEDPEGDIWEAETLCGLITSESLFVAVGKDAAYNATVLIGVNGECPAGCRKPRCQQCLRVATNNGWFDRELVDAHHKGRS